ncbi:MAG TPA: N-acetyltransferase [Planctomycetes bacterium]|nr:N-acetyltransferase [Planctomycetota bacterium]
MKTHLVGPETKRLEHRAFEVDDAEAFFALNGDPEVMRFTGEPMLSSVDEARQAISDYTDFEEFGFGRWACVLKSEGTVVGFCGLKYLRDLDEVDVGYRFIPEYWGRGLATEACVASLDFGFNVLGLEQIVAFVLPGNAASFRVLEKAGMQCEGEIDYDGTRVVRYVMRRDSRVAEGSGQGRTEGEG